MEEKIYGKPFLSYQLLTIPCHNDDDDDGEWEGVSESLLFVILRNEIYVSDKRGKLLLEGKNFILDAFEA